MVLELVLLYMLLLDQICLLLLCWQLCLRLLELALSLIQAAKISY